MKRIKSLTASADTLPSTGGWWVLAVLVISTAQLSLLGWAGIFGTLPASCSGLELLFTQHCQLLRARIITYKALRANQGWNYHLHCFSGCAGLELISTQHCQLLKAWIVIWTTLLAVQGLNYCMYTKHCHICKARIDIVSCFGLILYLGSCASASDGLWRATVHRASARPVSKHEKRPQLLTRKSFI